ncbi:MAG: LssY C-terminal domain-containing protein [Candidatus Scalindua sp.]|nr:LssY C-terminal domain-containing protein [Candidatus Scalindua sp.]
MKVLLIRFLSLVILLSWIPACKTYSPVPIEKVPFLDRSQTQTIGGVTVTAAVLSHEESEQIFGRPLAEKGIQPVWLEIVNREDLPYALISRYLDPTYFSASETARMNAVSKKDIDEQMAKDYRKLAIDIRVPPGQTRSGFVFTRLDFGTKVVSVLLFGPKQVRSLVFYITVPGLELDYQDVDFDKLYKKEELIVFDEEKAFREMLTNFQCCTENEKGTKDGDPLNLVLIGSRNELFGALARVGWDETEAVTFSTALKTAKAFFSGDMYMNAPISPQYLFGRSQDVALQKGRDSIHERNHLRLWLSPWIFLGKNVWIGQISRDIGIRLTTGVWNLTTHEIDPEVDDSRDYLISDIMSVQGLSKFGFVKGVGEATPENPRKILLGDEYWTDGLRAVMLLSEEPVAMDEVSFFIWDFKMKGAKEVIERVGREALSSP